MRDASVLLGAITTPANFFELAADTSKVCTKSPAVVTS
jgi:hypothetical protein